MLKRLVPWCFALGLALRIGLVFLGTPGSQLGELDDDGTHLRIAHNLVTDGEYRLAHYRAFRSPLFPFFAAAVYKIHGVDSYLALRIYLAIISMLIPWGVYMLGTYGISRRVGRVALVWACFHPPFIHYAAHLQGDSIFLVFATLAMAALIAEFSLEAGVFTGLACLGKSPFFAVVFIGGSWLWKRQDWRSAGIFLIGVAILVGPWWIRNYTVFNRFVPFSTEGGVSLWIGLNPYADGGGTSLHYTSDVPRGASELEENAWYLREAVHFAIDNPTQVARLAASKVTRLWGVVPRTGGVFVHTVAAFTYVPLFLLALWGAWHLRSPDMRWAPYAFLCLYYTVIHALFPSVMRYRLPLEPFLIVLASAGLLRIWDNELSRIE